MSIFRVKGLNKPRITLKT